MQKLVSLIKCYVSKNYPYNIYVHIIKAQKSFIKHWLYNKEIKKKIEE